MVQETLVLTIVAGIEAFALAGIGTRVVRAWLVERAILDCPNDRSSHVVPVPRGGGLAVIAAVAVTWIGLAAASGAGAYGLLALGALGLMALSWIDDRRGLSPLPRFAAHLLLVVMGLLMLGPDRLVFQGALPLWADRLLAGFGWLWFVNLYNFMDGIDGLAGVETVSLGVGIAAVAAIAGGAAIDGLSGGPLPFAVAIAGAGVGFLLWNWPPARIFLGDCGSIPLGYLLGALLICLAAEGQLVAALILPAYYLADATITLIWRLADGEKIWQAHRRHFYQRAVRGGRSHRAVTGAVLGGNLLLIGWACLAAVGFPGWAGLGAVVTVAALLGLLTRWAGGITR
jgi:UDP-N-acetylmuramyl pentapeptide phosphotransferase/UDP-N-acetylglucosamine-1-phosphate transferase